ncbi:hypothetical protein L1O03_00295 [Corynebacterium uropygiale]|uniref:Uncharacterized protein n=1 Tax=Corynebacterium uropygiale TaxID=1775911 RepID=A0A9X1QNP8_9CORY|nr:hypothetical protein [Corynebacterium uropygiale]MCF4005627.1 hypothetical protein [Corynebacterium uropygiale]
MNGQDREAAEWIAGYRRRLVDTQERSREMLSQALELGWPDAGFAGSPFPVEYVTRILHSERPREEKHQLLTYLLCHWYSDSVDGEWAYVPMRVTTPELYLQFGLGVSISGTSMMNLTEGARDLIDGQDVDFAKEYYETSVRIALRNRAAHDMGE